MEMSVLAKGLQMHFRFNTISYEGNIIDDYEGGSGTGRVDGYFYKNINRIFGRDLNIGQMVARHSISIDAELIAYEMHEPEVSNLYRLAAGIKNFEGAGSRAERSKHRIE